MNDHIGETTRLSGPANECVEGDAQLGDAEPVDAADTAPTGG